MPDFEEPSIVDIMAGSQPNAVELARAMNARLRKGQGLAALLATTPQYAPAAKVIAGDVGEQNKLLGQAGIAQMHYGPAAEAKRVETEAMAHPATAQAYLGMLRGYGVEVPANTPPQVLIRLLPLAEKAYEARMKADLMRRLGGGRNQQVVVGPDGNFVLVDKGTGESRPVTAPGGEGPSPPGLRQGKAIEPDVQKLAADSQFLANMPEDLAFLKKYVGKDRPGGGPLAGRVPDWATSAEGNAVRQASMRLINALVYMSTGKQINETEAERILMARGIGPKAAQSSFDVGMPALERELKRNASVYRSKYRPEALNLMRQRGGLDWLDKFADEGGSEIGVPEGKIRVREKTGKKRTGTINADEFDSEKYDKL